MLLGGDMLLPLFITVAVLPTQPAMVASLMKQHSDVMKNGFMKQSLEEFSHFQIANFRITFFYNEFIKNAYS